MAWLAIIVLIVALCISIYGSGSIRTISPPLLFLVIYGLLIHMGAVIFYEANPRKDLSFLVHSTLAIGAFAIGQLAIAVLVRTRVRRFVRSKATPINDLNRELGLRWNLLAGTAVFFSAIFLLEGYRAAGGFPIAESVTNVVDFTHKRIAFTSVSGAGYLSQFYGVILPVVSIGYLLRWLTTKRRFHGLIFWAVFAFTMFVLLAPGHRGPAMIYLTTIGIAVSYYYGALPTRHFAIIGTVVVVVFAGLTALAFRHNSDVSLAEALENRVATIQALGPQFIYRTFPRKMSFQSGATIAHDLEGVLPGKQEGFSGLIPALRETKSHNNPIGTFAEIYLNFGTPGLALFAFFWGALLQWFHARTLYSRLSISRIALASGIVMAMVWSALAGIVGTVFQYGILTILLMQVALRLKIHTTHTSATTPGITSTVSR